MRATRIFLSSTCYDLAHLRRELEEAIRGMGHQPVMSDAHDITIPPGLDTLETCKYLVSTSDIFVLVIGGRYGNVDAATAKSITNVEYDTAVSLKLPIYIFVDREVWTKRDVYRNLRQLVEAGTLPADKMTGLLGDKIQDVRIFGFLDQVTSATDGGWVFEFSGGPEIIEHLRRNWSALFQQLLADTRSGGRTTLGGGGPTLKLTWGASDGSPSSDALAAPGLPTLDQEAVLRQLQTLIPGPDEIARVTRQKPFLAAKLAHHGPVLKVQRHFASKSFDPVATVTEYAERIASWIKLAESDFAEFRRRYCRAHRLVPMCLVLENSGTEPASGIEIYLQQMDGVSFVSTDDRFDDTIFFSAERPHRVAGLLRLAELGDAMEIDAIKKLAADYRTARDLGTDVDVPMPSFGPPPVPPVAGSMHRGRLRIDVRDPLKHEFETPIKNFGYQIVCDLEETEVVEVPFSCHADNLTKSTIGKLTIRAAAVTGLPTLL